MMSFIDCLTHEDKSGQKSQIFLALTIVNVFFPRFYFFFIHEKITEVGFNWNPGKWIHFSNCFSVFALLKLLFSASFVNFSM